MLPKTAKLLKKHPPQRRLRHLEQLQQHEFIVKPPFCEKQSIGEISDQVVQGAEKKLSSWLNT